jgi:hypothetical protein
MTELKPRFPIRRFDVFADYNYVRNLEHDMKDDVARGRAIWAAKVVAGRRYGGSTSSSSGQGAGRHEGNGEHQKVDDDGFRSVGGELQTDVTFQKEIVDRMGREFYDRVFHPAIEQAVAEGKRYEDIRDQIRKDWKK